jgi:hypothetical protein
MKKHSFWGGILALLLVLGIPALAAEDKKTTKAKPYPLKVCIVSDEALGGDHGEPYVFVHEGQEFKLCCKPCRKDFDKDPKAFHKKLKTAAAKEKK